MKNRSYRNASALTILVLVCLALASAFAPHRANAQGQAGTTLIATDPALTITWTRTYPWTIQKSVTPGALHLFNGESGTANYTVTVTRGTPVDQAYISGSVCVTNGGAVATENLTIIAVLKNGGAKGSPVVSTTPVDVSGNPVLDSGEQGCYSFQVTLPASVLIPGNTLRIDTDITITNHSGHLGTPFGPSPAGTVVVPNPTEVNASVTVNDTNGQSWTFSGSGSQQYSRNFTCGQDGGTQNNTATIVQTGQLASASVTVNCYGLTVSKDANTTFTRTYKWKISKSVTPNPVSMFAGENQDVNYTVDVTSDGYDDSAHRVTGTITVSNPHPFSAATISLSDSVDGINATLDCGGSLTIPAGGSATCGYSADLSDGTSRTNTATASLLGYDYQGTAGVSFDNPTTEVNKTVNVTDSLAGSLGSASGNGNTFTYAGNVACSTSASDYTNGSYTYDRDNTATIVETSQSADAKVTVNCYAPTVKKTATTTYTRTYTWTIDKTSGTTALTLSTGQQQLVSYTVTLSYTSADGSYAVSGVITVNNPHPDAAMTVSVEDTISGFSGTITLDCGGTLTVPAGSSATCEYSTSLPDNSSRTNTATVTLNGLSVSATADITFGDPTTVTDECVNASDDKYGSLGTFCAPTVSSPKTITYSTYVGPYSTCGIYTHVNVASFETTDTKATGSDNHSIAVNVPCGGCALTQGYWKTHSSYGPAPYDDTWAQLANGANTPFFLSGLTWYQMFWTAPSGNVYYNLAKQYAAAYLNKLNGADTTAINTELAQAFTLLNTYTPAQVGAMRPNNAVRAQFVSLAAKLDQYNNGLIGPGHCSE